MENKLQMRPMSYDEWEQYQDYIEEMQQANLTPDKLTRKLARYVGEKIYGLDPKDNKVSIVIFMKALQDTMELTNKQNEEEVKNLETSGNGVSVAE